MERKHYLLIVLIPAFIAGFFALTPKIYDIITEPKKVLNYSINIGPAIQEISGYKSILVIEIKNNGKAKLNNITGTIQLREGAIEKMTFKDSNSLHPTIIPHDKSIEITCKSLLYNDNIIISLLAQTVSHKPNVEITIRSDEIRAEEILLNEKNKNDSYLSIIGAALSAISVFVMSIFVIKNKSLLNIIGKAAYKNKNDILFYIAINSSNEELIEMVNQNEKLAYLRFSDSISEKFKKTKDKKLISAQYCLLLIKEIVEDSRKIIFENLKLMGCANLPDEDIKKIDKVRTNDLIKIRNEIDKIFSIEFDEYIKTLV